MTDLATRPPRSGSKDRTALPARLLAGRSVLGRPIRFEAITPLHLRPRVLVVAGQHGDEPGGPLSWQRLLGRDRPRLERLGLGLAAIPVANPDGQVANERTTAEGMDLNRDHFALRSPETRAIHRVLHSLSWDVVLDLHTYPSRRLATLRRGWILDDDVLLGTATTPAVLDRPPVASEEDLLTGLSRTWDAAGIHGGGYRLFQRSGRVRRSTMAPIDLRNVAALRYGSYSILVEGRAPRAEDDAAEKARLVDAQATTVLGILEWVAARPAQFRLHREPPHAGQRLPLRARWTWSRTGSRITIREPSTGARRTVSVPDFHGSIEVTRSIRLPEAYALPANPSQLLEGLLHQGFAWEPGERWVGRYPGRVRPDDLVFPIAQAGGGALAVWIQSESPSPGRLWRRLAAEEVVSGGGSASARAGWSGILGYSPSRAESDSANRSTSSSPNVV